MASLDTFGVEQDEAGVVLDVLANDEGGVGELSLTGFTPGSEPIGDVNSGVLGNDGDTGTAYLMYSAEATHTRFSGFAASQADHLVTVKHNGTDWLLNYFVSGQGDTWTAFTPVASDVLVAEITMQAGDDAVASLEGESFVVEGIEAGYASGDLAFIANQWQDVYNRDEYDVTGTTFTRNIRTEHGRLVDNGDGTLGYTPDAGFMGSDQFLYAASDGQTYSVSASDLEAHYLFGEGTGTSSADDSGNGLALTLSGAGWAEGRAGAIGGTGGGGALLLDGVDDFASATGFTSTSQMTLSAWIRADALGGEQTIIGQSGSFALKLSGSQLRFTAPGVADHTVSAGVADLVAGQWQHVAVSFDAGQTGGAKFYVDGELVATLDASAMGTNSNDLWVGKNQWGQFFNGAIDDVRVDSRVLTADEVAILAEASTAAVSVSVNASVDIEAARDTLLAGVTSLADPGSPGHLLAYGPTAFSVSNYTGANLSDPMIAAATWGAGRVVALPDHQWLELTTHGGDASTAAFYGNGIEWLADSAALSVKVVTCNHAANAAWLTAQGYTNVVNATSATLATELADADVLVGGWLGTNPPEADLDVIRDFVANQGGGLFIADYGIGYDWWWGQAAEDIPSNRLLREAGIGFVKAYPHGGGAQTINRAVGQVTADDVLALLNDSSGATQAEKDQAAAIYTMLNGLLAEDDALQAELDAVFWSRINTINPTPTTPVSDSFEKALLRREMDLLGALAPEEVTAHRTAEDVYGAIDVNAPRLTNQSVTIDADTTGLIATGLYAAPGDLVTVTLPAALVGQGYTLRINNHVDSIAGHGSYARVPYNVSRSFAIDSATVQIANAFGGHIYIDMGGQAGGTSSGLGSQQITIDGAIAAPMFVLGQTTDAEWISTIRGNPAPYAEFVSGHLAFSVPSDWIRTLDNPTQLMQYWDDAVSFMDYIAGTDALRTGPERINLDVAISVGLLHAGYPIQGPTSYGSSIVDYEALTSGGDWGWFHELGHEIQRQTALGWGWDNPWTFGGDVEVTVNIFANAALELMAPGTGTAGWGYSAHAEAVMAAAVATINDTNAPNFEQKDPYPFYFQLADGFGWDMYRTVLSGYVDDAQNNPTNLPQDNQQEKDQWLTRWSQATGYNLADYMVNKWGLEVSQAAIDAVNAMSLPSWLPVVPGDTTQRVAHAGSMIFDPATAGVGLDATATFVSVAAASAQSGAITLNADGTYTYSPDADFVGTDLIDVTYQSSAGNTVTTAIRVEVYQLAAQPDKAQWTLVSADSEETVGENGAAINAFDGDPSTIWHTQWNGGSPAHPHELVIDLGGRYDLDGFTYIPRQSGTNGRIANYEFYTSNDGVTWGSAVASGTFANNANAQGATFAPTAGRYIKLVALSEVNGNAWSSVAELDVSGTLATPDADDFELVSVSSEETVGENGAATNALDGDPNTIWHTQYLGGTDAHPHELVLELGARFDLDGFTYLPRQVGVNGRIADYAFYTSLDGINWGTAVATGTFTNIADLQTVSFAKTTGQFVKLVALSEVNGNAWTTVAELGVSGAFASAGEAVPVAADDTADVLMDQPSDLDVIGNDIDPDRGDTFTISVVGQGAHGTAVANGSGGITYTPDAGFYGTDTITYAVADSTGRTSNTATVTISVGGLVSHWALDEGTGTTAADAEVNNAAGTITNATWTAGVHNNALDFNGQDSVVNLGTAASLSGESDFTAAAWINTTDTNGGTIIQQRDNGSPGYEGQYRFRMNADGTLNFFIYNGGQQFNLSTTQQVNDGRWHHVAAQRDGLEGRIYIDGVLAASVIGTEIKALSPAISVAIGANIRDNDDFFKGTIDDVQLHSRSIDAAEVASLYQAMPNLAPAASADHLAAAVNTAAVISPLSNDFDHNAADTLSITSFTQPTHGTVTDNGDGTLTYTPNTGFGSIDAQLDTFTYTVSDDQGGSTTANVLVTVGETQTPSTFITTGGTAQVTATGNHQYELNLDFTNAPAAIDQIIIDWGNGQITHATSASGWGPDITSTATNQWAATQHTYDPAQVQHIKVYAKDTTGKVQQSKVILDQDVVFDLTVESYSPTSVRLTWHEKSYGESGFLVSVSPVGENSFTPWMTVGANATAALLTGLPDGVNLEFQVQAIVGDIDFDAPAEEGEPLGNADRIAYEMDQLEAGEGMKWYMVQVPSSWLYQGSAGYTHIDSMLEINAHQVTAWQDAPIGNQAPWEVVWASSHEDAIWQAVKGSAEIKAPDVEDPYEFTLDQSEGAFRIGTFGEFSNVPGSFNINATFPDDQYLIVLEDKYYRTDSDNDYDDWYWDIYVEEIDFQFTVEHVDCPELSVTVDQYEVGQLTIPLDVNHEADIQYYPSIVQMLDQGGYGEIRVGSADLLAFTAWNIVGGNYTPANPSHNFGENSPALSTLSPEDAVGPYTVVAGWDFDQDGLIDSEGQWASVQVDPIALDSLNVADINNLVRNVDVAPDEVVDPLYVEANEAGLADIRLTPDVLPNDADSRAFIAWEVLNGAVIVDAGQFNAPTQDVTLPTPDSIYTVNTWIDANLNGVWDQHCETGIATEVIPVQLVELAVANSILGLNTQYEVAATAPPAEEIYIAIKADGTADIDFDAMILSGDMDGYTEVLWEASAAGAMFDFGNFGVNPNTATLNIVDNNRSFELVAGFDGDKDDILDDEEISRTINITVLGLEEMTLTDPDHAADRTLNVTPANNDGTLYIGADASGIGRLDLDAMFKPAGFDAGQHVIWQIEESVAGVDAPLFSGDFSAMPPVFDLAGGTYTVKSGLDIDLDGEFDPAQGPSLLTATLHVVDLQVLRYFDPFFANSSFDHHRVEATSAAIAEGTVFRGPDYFLEAEIVPGDPAAGGQVLWELLAPFIDLDGDGLPDPVEDFVDGPTSGDFAALAAQGPIDLFQYIQGPFAFIAGFDHDGDGELDHDYLVANTVNSNEGGIVDADNEVTRAIVITGPAGFEFNLAADSNNDGYADFGGSDETVEEIDDQAGMFVVVNDGDRDKNGIRDFADGYEDGGLASESVLTAEGTSEIFFFWDNVEDMLAPSGGLWAKFDYDASDPLQAGIAQAGDDAMDPLQGTLRLWAETGPLDEDGRWSGKSINSYSQPGGSFEDNGNFIPSGEWVNLDYLRTGGIFEILSSAPYSTSLFVEAVGVDHHEPLKSITVTIGIGNDENNDGSVSQSEIEAASDFVDTIRVRPIQAEVPFYGDPTSLIGVGDGADGGDPLAQSFVGPLRLDGQTSYSTADLLGNAFAWGFGHGRTWTSDPVARVIATNGNGQFVSSMPSLIDTGGTVIVVAGGGSKLFFDRTAEAGVAGEAVYSARFFSQDTLVDIYDFEAQSTNGVLTGDAAIDERISQSIGVYILTDSEGNQFIFGLNDPAYDDRVEDRSYYNWSSTYDTRHYTSGRLDAIVTVGGHTIAMEHSYEDVEFENELGNTRYVRAPKEDIIRRTLGNGIEETWVYTYEPFDPDRHLLTGESEPEDLQPRRISSVEVMRGDENGEVIRSVSYEYYADDEQGNAPVHGAVGDLKFAKVHLQDLDSDVIETTYYRYGEDADGDPTLLVMEPAAYIRATQGSANIDVAADATAEATLLAHGAIEVRTNGFQAPGLSSGGDSASNAGQGGYDLDVSLVAAPKLGPDAEWYTVTVTPTHAGPVETYTLNAAREVLSYSVAADGKTWESHFTYNPDGRLLSASSPSDLTTNYVYYGDDEGDNSHRLHQIWVASGRDDSAPGYRANLLTSFAYTAHEGVVWIDTITEQGGGGPDALPWIDIVTDFDYITDGSGNLVVMTKLPPVSIGHHGTGVADTITETFDIHGQAVQTIYTDGATLLYTTDTSAYDYAARTLTQTLGVAAAYAGLVETTYYDDFGRATYTQHADNTRTYYHIHQTATTLEVTVQSGWPAGGGAPLGNAVKTVTNLANGTSITAVYAPNLNGQSSSPFGDFDNAIDTSTFGPLLSTTQRTYDRGGRLIKSEITQAAGTDATSRPKTTYKYDNEGRLHKTHRFYDTGINDFITDETVFDTLGRVIQLKSADQVIQSFVYDDTDNMGVGEVGDGNITHVTLHPSGEEDGTAADPNRTTFNVYDWRNRLVVTKQGSQITEADDINRPMAVYFYDNLNQLYKTDIYDGDGITPGYDFSNDQVTWASSPIGGSLERTDYTDLDARGQIYQTRSVDPDPQANYTVTTGFWYDALGRVIKQKAPGGLITKITYDALGQVTDVYLTDDSSGGVAVGSDNVLEHTHTEYDNAGNATYITTKQRTASGSDRISYVSNYYDTAGRLLHSINHGTNTPPNDQRPSVAELADGGAFGRDHGDNTVKFLRTDYQYSNDGLTITVKDPRGIDHETTVDALGRTIKTIEAAGEDADILHDFEPASNDNENPLGIQRTTTYRYDALGRVVEQSLDLPDADTQVTGYIYNGNGGRSLSTIHLPGFAEAEASPNRSSVPYILVYDYNALGEVTETPAPSLAIHQEYDYDVLGRLIQAQVFPGVNEGQDVVTDANTVRSYGYDTLGNVTQIGSVSRDYNAFGQIISESNAYTYSYANVNGGVRATGITYSQSGRIFT